MKVVGFAGFSGSGKTTLMVALIGLLRERGQRVSVLKHAHHAFDVDTPGKDSHRHRSAGAFEVGVLSDQRWVLMREFGAPVELSVHHALAEFSDAADWVLVEGFKSSDILKIEVWRAATGDQARYPFDDFIAAIATDSPELLPQATQREVLDLNQPQRVLEYLLSQAERFTYRPELHLP